MGTIIAIEKQKRRRRAFVYLEDAPPLDLRLDVIAAAGLRPGMAIGLVRAAELVAEDQRLSASDAALRLLAAGPRSRKDLRLRLTRRGFSREAVDAAIERMQQLGYLDDAAFARFFVETRQAATPRSKRALTFELTSRGVSREHIEAAFDGHSDAEAAYEAARRRFRALHGLDYRTFERRLGGFLAARGFGYGVARATVQRCWTELREQADAIHDAGASQ
ncbi:MAG TPA: regulatory protein RecX [Dehalococcoidia bacterium]|nr:regulatory protein RecX [Dehalococcoidia bacterium]